MKVLTSTKDLSREEWLEYRRMGIGSSDAPTIVGLNPYAGLYSLWADKKGLAAELEVTEPMRQGTDLEDYVAKRFMEETGKKVRRRNAILQSKENPFMLANLDRLVIGENVPLECKTTSIRNKSDFDGGDIPPYYYVQVQHQLAVTGAEYAYLAVLVLSAGFYWFKIDRHEEDIKALIDAERKFWQEHMQTETPPEPDGSRQDSIAIKGLPAGEETALPVSMVLHEHLIERLEEIGRLIEPFKREQEEIKQKLMLAMGTAHRGELNKGNISYKPYVRTTIDSKLLRNNYPDIYDECSKQTVVRALRINGR